MEYCRRIDPRTEREELQAAVRWTKEMDGTQASDRDRRGAGGAAPRRRRAASAGARAFARANPLRTAPPRHCCRWHNHLSPAVKKEPFSDYEDAVIFKVRGRLRGAGQTR